MKLLVFGMLLSLAVPGAQPKRPGVHTPGVRIPMSRLQPDATFQIPGSPDWIAIDEFVWVSNKPRNNIARVDPRTNLLVGMVASGKSPCSGLAAAFGSLWVPNCGDSSLTRIELTTGVVTATFPMTIADSEGGLTAGAGSIWMLVDRKGTLARIDPATNKAVLTIRVAPGSYTAVFGEGAVWITSTETGSLTRVDPTSNKIAATISIGKRPRFLTAGGGFVWTLNQLDGSVTKVDVRTNRVVATIQVGVPGDGGDICYGEGSVWVTSLEFPLSRIDLKTNQVVQQFVGVGGDAIRAGHGSIWLSNNQTSTLWRLDPKKVAAITPIKIAAKQAQ